MNDEKNNDDNVTVVTNIRFPKSLIRRAKLFGKAGPVLKDVAGEFLILKELDTGNKTISGNDGTMIYATLFAGDLIHITSKKDGSITTTELTKQEAATMARTIVELLNNSQNAHK